MSKQNAALLADNAMFRKATTKPDNVGELKMFVDGREICPEGYVESNRTKGMILVGRPTKGITGATFNRPFDPDEVGRMPVHSHATSVYDPGHSHDISVTDPEHSHAASVSDPGHSHGLQHAWSADSQPDQYDRPAF